MTIITTYAYSVPGNYTYDIDKIEIVSGEAALKLQIEDRDFTEDFADDTGFVYDSGKVEFVGGQVQQKDTRIANALAYWSFTTDKDAVWTNGVAAGVGTLGGGATVTGGIVDLNSTGEYFRIGATDWVFGNGGTEGTFRFTYIPNYNGSPSTDTGIFEATGSSNANAIFLSHLSAGSMKVDIRDSSGGAHFFTGGSFSPTLGQRYVFELNIDTNGTSKLFIDGILQVNMSTSSITRTNTGIGSCWFPRTGLGRFSLDDLITFDAVQHTANHSSELPFSYTENVYVSSNVELPEIEHTLPGVIHFGVSLSTTETGTPRYTIQVGQSGVYQYWDGAAWATSDETYAQANSAADFNTNFTTLDIADEEFGQFQIHFTDSDTQSSVDELTANLNVDNDYLTTSPSIMINSAVTTDDLITFANTVTETGSNLIKHTLMLGTTEYYFDGSSWVISNGTYLQANTADEINTNAATFASILGNGAEIKINSFLYSADGKSTPSLDQVSIAYSFYAGREETSMATVYGYVLNNKTPVSGAIVSAKTSAAFIDSNNTIDVNTSTTSRSNGYFEMDLPKTSDAGTTLDVEIHYVDEQGSSKYKRYTINVTATASSQKIEDLIV